MSFIELHELVAIQVFGPFEKKDNNEQNKFFNEILSLALSLNSQFIFQTFDSLYFQIFFILLLHIIK